MGSKDMLLLESALHWLQKELRSIGVDCGDRGSGHAKRLLRNTEVLRRVHLSSVSCGSRRFRIELLEEATCHSPKVPPTQIQQGE